MYEEALTRLVYSTVSTLLFALCAQGVRQVGVADPPGQYRPELGAISPGNRRPPCDDAVLLDER